ncbi:MAG: hypothetical protein JWO05_3960 [Gemmatimonadetes bacterium]|nr:hypothetical protein [Gemmatimonadota bacterium]
MKNAVSREPTPKPYVAPTITRVHADPVRELLMVTSVCFQLGDPNCTNTNC